SVKAYLVGAVRAFSGGCLQMKHLQRNISSQAFKAQITIRPWSKTPLMPDF
ncbi:hypothetical protein SERLA73DRAFT_29107, partial [Serpula lacrymans var. lacrymans S7.3]